MPIAAVNQVDDYARAVVAGEVPAGKYHRLSCERHLRDRARQASPDFPYWFSIDRAMRFVRFAGRLKHYKGPFAGQFIRLQPFQVFRLGSIFGWLHTDTGLRRFRTAYNEIPRKNGKSLEAAIVALYVSFFDGEPGAEGYCIATKREQAKIVFNDAKRLVRSSGLRSRIAVLTANLNRDDTASKLEPLGADRDSTDGLNPSLIITDEFHAQKNRGLLDVMETATGARAQPLNFQITTAGNDPVSPCGDQHDYAVKVLEGVLTDETFFAFIAHTDAGDDPWSEDTWRKANPNYGVSVRPDDLRAIATKARHMPDAAPAFKQKRLNMWVNAAAPWLSMDGWRAGQSPWPRWAERTDLYVPAQLLGRRCWIGIDMSSKIDLTALVMAFPPDAPDATDDAPDAGPADRRWSLLAWCLTPADTLAARALKDRAPYAQWVERGWLRTNPGNRIDQDQIRAWVAEAATLFQVQQIGFDPWNAGNLVKHLEDDGFQVIEVPQNLSQMSAPSKDFEADVLDGLVDAGDNELFAWCASNAVVARDDKDNIYPTKKRSRGRIDPLVAALIARKLAAIDSQDVEDPELIVA